MNNIHSDWSQAVITDLIAYDGIFADGDWIESKDQDLKGSIRLLQLADIGDGKFIDKSRRYINEFKFNLLGCTEVLENDVLVARMPDPLGRASILPKLSQRCITVVDVAIIRPGSNSVIPKWLMFFLNAPEIRQTIELLASGTTRKRISRSNLAQISLPIPPFNEQKRIANKLDLLLARVNACREHLERVPGILKHFRQQVLAAATSGQLTEEWRNLVSQSELKTIEDLSNARKRAWELYERKRRSIKNVPIDNNIRNKYIDPVGPENTAEIIKPKSWILVSTDQLTFLITDGKHGDCRDEQDSGYYFLSVKDLYQGDLHYENARQINREDFLEVHYRTNLEVGDVLVTNAGTIGRVAIARDKEKVNKTTFQKSVAILKPLREIVLPEYLAMYIENSVIHLEEKSSGTAVKNLLLRDLRQIIVALPSMEEQQEIVRRVEILFNYADRLEARYRTAQHLVDNLTQSMLSKAFRGELVPRDPNDEPASVLLERIQAERAKLADQPKRIINREKSNEVKMTEDSVKDAIRKLPKDNFSFEELREQLPGDYEEIKSILFKLLSEPKPCISQVFDPSIKSIRFVRRTI
jgi:type I restriction enzyme, S subunit